MLTKEQVRIKILSKLRAQEEENRDRKSRNIKEKLFRTKVFKQAKNVMFYIAMKGEVNTTEMIKEARLLGKKIIVPVCKSNRRDVIPCMLNDGAELKKSLYGVCEPVVARRVAPEEVDLVVVPGVAFDKKGNRLGRGKGCYDRFLQGLSERAMTIGLAFDFQILPSIPVTAHDVSVKKLIFA